MNILRFHIGGIFKYGPCRYEDGTIVEWKCVAEDVSYEFMLWLCLRMRVNNVSRIFLYKKWDGPKSCPDLDFIQLTCDTMMMLVDILRLDGAADLYVEHDKNWPLWNEDENNISASDLCPAPYLITIYTFSHELVELVGGTQFNIEEGVSSSHFPPEPVGITVDWTIADDATNGDDTSSSEDGDYDDDDDVEELTDHDSDEGGLGRWVSGPGMSDDEEYLNARRRIRKQGEGARQRVGGEHVET